MNYLEQVFGNRFDPERRRKILCECESHAARSFVYRMREHTPYRWTPVIRVEGYRHIESALSQGHGAILWIGRFIYGSIVAKKGLASIGVRLHHLSRPQHAYFGSKFALKVLTPIYVRAETRNLAERIVLGPDRGVAALTRVCQRLRENEVVSITAGNSAMQTVAIPLHGCRIMLATGPINLALSSGAPLLPVFTVRNGAGEFDVKIERPIDFGRVGDSQAKVRAAALDIAARLAPYATEYVEQYELFRERIVDPVDRHSEESETGRVALAAAKSIGAKST